MKTNKVIKIVATLLLALTLVTAFTTCVSAFDWDLILGLYDDPADNSGASDSVANIINAIIYIVRIVGVGVAIIMLIVLAIKYIAASPEGKGEIKKTATVYIVGAIILFAASAILGIIQNFANNVTDGSDDALLTILRLG